MGQLKSMDLREPGSHSATDASPAKPSKSLWWLWVVVIAGIVVGIWYFRGSRITSEAADPSLPATSGRGRGGAGGMRSEEHTSELQSRLHLVCRLLLEKKKK